MADPNLPRSAAGDRSPWLIAFIVSVATFMAYRLPRRCCSNRGNAITRLAEHVTTYNGYAWNAPLPPIDDLIQAQAGIMSYLDIFWMLGMLGLCIWSDRAVAVTYAEGRSAGPLGEEAQHGVKRSDSVRHVIAASVA